jgi:hypothetical protein
VVGEPDENAPLKTVNRYRDVAVRPDGLALFIVTDVGGNTQDASGRPAAKVENSGAILEFRYVAAQQAAAAPALPDVQKLGPQVGDRVPDFALNDQHGQPRTLTSLMGPNGLVLVFYRSADW